MWITTKNIRITRFISNISPQKICDTSNRHSLTPSIPVAQQQQLCKRTLATCAASPEEAGTSRDQGRQHEALHTFHVQIRCIPCAADVRVAGTRTLLYICWKTRTGTQDYTSCFYYYCSCRHQRLTAVCREAAHIQGQAGKTHKDVVPCLRA